MLGPYPVIPGIDEMSKLKMGISVGRRRHTGGVAYTSQDSPEILHRLLDDLPLSLDVTNNWRGHGFLKRGGLALKFYPSTYGLGFEGSIIHANTSLDYRVPSKRITPVYVNRVIEFMRTF